MSGALTHQLFSQVLAEGVGEKLVPPANRSMKLARPESCQYCCASKRKNPLTAWREGSHWPPSSARIEVPRSGPVSWSYRRVSSPTRTVGETATAVPPFTSRQLAESA